MTSVSRKATNQMIVEHMLGALSGSGIRLYLPGEAPPNGGPDQAGDTPVTKWCKLHRVAMGASQRSGGADERTLSFTISVGVSDAELGDDLHALDDTLAAVRDAIEDATAAHSDGVHTLQMGEADDDILSAGDAEANATGVVSVVGSVRRSG